MMELLSYIMPKLAWIIPLVMLCFVIYVASNIRERRIYDEYIKENGVDVEAVMTEVTYDQYQRINNHLVAILTLEYSYEGKKITSKRGVFFGLLTERNSFLVRQSRSESTLKNSLIFITWNTKPVDY